MKINENGRSMIEMLGVIAIIGILSVGGIYGYTTSMRKRKVNEIVHVANMLATQARSADGGTGECLFLSQSGFDTKVAGIDLEMVADPGPTGSPVEVSVQINDEDMSEDELAKLCEIIGNTSSSEYTVECKETVSCSP